MDFRSVFRVVLTLLLVSGSALAWAQADRSPSDRAPQDRSTIQRTASLPASPELLQELQIADEFAAEGRFDEAEEKYREIIRRSEGASDDSQDANFAEAYNNLAVLYMRQMNYDQARNFLQQAVDASELRNAVFGIPKSYIALTNLALIDFYEGRYDEARQGAEEALSLQQNFGPALMVMGLYYKNVGTRGVRQVGDFAGQNSQHQRLTCNIQCNERRRTCASEGNCDEVQAFCASCNDLGPVGDLSALTQAQQYFEAAQRNTTDERVLSDTMVNMGFSLAAEGNRESYQRAVELADQAEAVDSTNPYVFALKGYLNQHFRREAVPAGLEFDVSLDDALAAYRQGLTLADTDRRLTAYFYYNIACIFALQNRGLEPVQGEPAVFHYLGLAVENGYCDLEHMRFDQDFHHMTLMVDDSGSPIWNDFVDSLSSEVDTENCVRE